MIKQYDCIVVGAGHAGIEAALAAARLGCKTLLLTMDLDKIGQMSCNPAIGGVGKGQLVKEIDALGGQMGKSADATAIQFRQLNTSKGLAVRSSRCQSDREKYRLFAKHTLEKQDNLFLKQAEAVKIIFHSSVAEGIQTKLGEKFFAKTIVICPGTFLNGFIHIGLSHFSGGRMGEPASLGLSKNLKDLGIKLKRFNTCTCPRIDGRTINFRKLQAQPQDKKIIPFSFSTKDLKIKQIPCYITFTNTKTHKIIRFGIKKTLPYIGVIQSSSVRYCPSIEDKITRFPERQRHQIFLEPEGRDTYEVYPNGLFTNLPLDTQIKMLHSIKGLEDVKIMRIGYGIEYDLIDPTQLYPTLETKLIKNLYLAGQINGTTGYEEAAAQGLVAGINAALRAKGSGEFILNRSQAYIGVLIDDLVTKGTSEPYRMFTSRVEYRLLLREDNADLRLREKGFNIGLIQKRDFQQTQKKIYLINQQLDKLKETSLKPTQAINRKLKKFNSSPLSRSISLEQILKRPEIDFDKLIKLDHFRVDIPDEIKTQVETEVKYFGFIQRQLKEVERFKKIENIKVPSDLEYANISGLSSEIKEKLSKFRPLSLGQASRISGVTPAAISILMVYLQKK
ncbi:MAG: tRNA uridine-5-carboxymethylaminomethyl(34) synthesis enzyme MnmG [Candidatus Omnitrophota bacterium]